MSLRLLSFAYLIRIIAKETTKCFHLSLKNLAAQNGEGKLSKSYFREMNGVPRNTYTLLYEFCYVKEKRKTCRLQFTKTAVATIFSLNQATGSLISNGGGPRDPIGHPKKYRENRSSFWLSENGVALIVNKCTHNKATGERNAKILKTFTKKKK